MDIIFEQRRNAFSRFADLCGVLNDFSYHNNSRVTEELKAIVQLNSQIGMPLPSGRWGNSLAVALEMQHYQGALFMILNADELGIDLDSISSEIGGREVWNVQETFAFSKLDFDVTRIARDDKYYKNYPNVIQSHNSNIDAFLEISRILQDKMKSYSK